MWSLHFVDTNFPAAHLFRNFNNVSVMRKIHGLSGQTYAIPSKPASRNNSVRICVAT